MVTADCKIIEAKETAWLEPFTAQLRSVLVFPNPRSNFRSLICDEAAPEAATEEGQVILCTPCFAAYKAGAEIVPDE